MPARHTVNVTQEDIDAALRNNSSRCIVATAIAREYPKASRISVDVHAIKFTVGDRRYTHLCPPPVADYIVAFDAGDDIHPFRFYLRDDQRLVVRRQRRTPAGKKLHNAAERRKKATVALERVAADPTVSAAQVQVAREQMAAAAAEEALVKAEMAAAGERSTATEPPLPDVPAHEQVSGRRKRAGVFHRNERVYGGRVMRINDPDDAPGDFRGPLDTE
jgi:hypothetical protein